MQGLKPLPICKFISTSKMADFTVFLFVCFVLFCFCLFVCFYCNFCEMYFLGSE